MTTRPPTLEIDDKKLSVDRPCSDWAVNVVNYLLQLIKSFHESAYRDVATGFDRSNALASLSLFPTNSPVFRNIGTDDNDLVDNAGIKDLLEDELGGFQGSLGSAAGYDAGYEGLQIPPIGSNGKLPTSIIP